ncbi:MAG: plastocyanin/azurin family copper-binding protein [Candidatus Thermoplasmatota archaeon]
MRAILLTTIALVSLYAVAPGFANAGTPYQATMGERALPQGPMYYEPNYMTIAAGDSVTWKNVGQKMHEIEFHFEAAEDAEVGTAVSLDNPTSPPDLMHIHVLPGKSFTYTFAEKGVYVLNCNLGNDHTPGKQVVVVS